MSRPFNPKPDELTAIMESFRKELEPVIERLRERGISNEAIAYGLTSFGLGLMEGVGVSVHDIDSYLRTYVDKVILGRSRA